MAGPGRLALKRRRIALVRAECAGSTSRRPVVRRRVAEQSTGRAFLSGWRFRWSAMFRRLPVRK